MKNRCLFIFLLAFHLAFSQPANFTAKGIGGGGALFALSINPADNNEYYVSCDMGELFHTTNYGGSYDQVNFSRSLADTILKYAILPLPVYYIRSVMLRI